MATKNTKREADGALVFRAPTGALKAKPAGGILVFFVANQLGEMIQGFGSKRLCARFFFTSPAGKTWPFIAM